MIQYGRIRKFDVDGSTKILRTELDDYYNSYDNTRESRYKSQLGDDINWDLSFSHIRESESTKHVHRLHPYKGKFIPQLVEYFIDTHTDNFKQEVYFNRGDIILDPFSGSGTTMVQANECSINAVGVDVSSFNALIANCKVGEHDINAIYYEVNRITDSLNEFISGTNITEFENELSLELNRFNNEFFPVPEYKYRLHRKEINEKEYAPEMEKRFLLIYNTLIEKYKITLQQRSNSTFLEKWYFQGVRDEIDYIYEKIHAVSNVQIQNILKIILSRTMRSCRATTHSDLATLIDPIASTYYCTKHCKLCKPLFSIAKWWTSHANDTIKRIMEFTNTKTSTLQYCITGDSRTVDIITQLQQNKPELADLVIHKKINGIFSSPPYVGMIDYHEQHAYAYDLFGFERNDESEIGPLFKGKGVVAQKSYVDGIAQVLINCKRYFVDDYNVFLVANDKHNLYPTIAGNAGMKIVNEFQRPVLNRSEKNRTAYSETIFHLKEDK